MNRLMALTLVVFVCMAGLVEAQTCTDASGTNCSVKKNQPFQVTADAALTSDVIPTESFRLYSNGVKVGDVVNTGVAPVFTFAAGIAVAGDYVLFMEALSTIFDASGQPQEISSGPSNTVTLHVVTGSLSAPKNLRIIRK